MFKKLLMVLFCFVALPTQAKTKPTDTVRITNMNAGYKNYAKPWGKVKLDKSTVIKLNQRLAEFEKEHSDVFRIGHLFLAHGKVTRVALFSQRGIVIMMDWPKGSICTLTFDSQGGFAGIHGKACIP